MKNVLKIQLLGFVTLLFSWSDPVSAYKLLSGQWNTENGPIRYAVEKSGSDDITDGSDLQAIHNAFRSWSCIPGSRIRFLESDFEGKKISDPSDNVSNIFWDETGEFMLGPATLGVTIGNASQDATERVVYTGSDIIFNGSDHSWSTTGEGEKTDIESVAVHESGHFLGLEHPCEDTVAKTGCLTGDESVMTPAISAGELNRTPREDDINGVLEVYPLPEGDNSTCNGPYRKGEPCPCNDECIGDLLCSAAGGEYPICIPDCGLDQGSCPDKYVCVLAKRGSRDKAPGACVKQRDPLKRPDGAICSNDRECSDGAFCSFTKMVGRKICQRTCDNENACSDGYTCTEKVCLTSQNVKGIACPVENDGEEEEPPEGCDCDSNSSSSAELTFSLFFMIALIRRRR